MTSAITASTPKQNRVAKPDKYRQEDYEESQKPGVAILEDGFRKFGQTGIGGVRQSLRNHPESAKKVFYMLSNGAEVIHPSKETYNRLLNMGISREEIMTLKSILSPTGNDVTLGGFMSMA